MKRIYILLLTTLLVKPTFSQIILPQIIADSMVLQRDATVKIWGWASSGEKVKLTFNGINKSAISGKDGKWSMVLPAMRQGGPYNMQLVGKNTITIKGILLGDVWLCAGQSNMVHQMRLHAVRYQQDIQEANYPEIRQFLVPTANSLKGPNDTLPKTQWKTATPVNVQDFSAVAYFFARNIYQKHKVPIGIINSSVGGTPIEAWTSEEGLKKFDDVISIVTQNKDTNYVNKRNREQAFIEVNPLPDKGLSSDTPWYFEKYRPVGWSRINIPGYWEDQGVRDLDGVVWYRKEIDLPKRVEETEAQVFLGRIVDADVLYINGRQVGNTTYQYPQRIYNIPKGVLKEGKNLFVIKVQNNFGKGGFVPDKPYHLQYDGNIVDLKGYWDYKVGLVKRQAISTGNKGPIAAQNQPTALYNAMIAPIINFSIKGVLWYQGESNISNAYKYQYYLPALIKDWRTKFNHESLPFYYVQLPNFGDASYLPSESSIAVVREAALKTLQTPNTGMAITIDLGEWNDIHPDRKKEVGDRLALLARHYNYDEDSLVFSGPLVNKVEIDKNEIIISFKHIGKGLQTTDGEVPGGFFIAGADKKFVYAEAKIVDNKVVLHSTEVAEPKYVRYGWADNPPSINLYNSEGLPASPFRTDE